MFIVSYSLQFVNLFGLGAPRSARYMESNKRNSRRKKAFLRLWQKTALRNPVHDNTAPGSFPIRKDPGFFGMATSRSFVPFLLRMLRSQRTQSKKNYRQQTTPAMIAIAKATARMLQARTGFTVALIPVFFFSDFFVSMISVSSMVMTIPFRCASRHKTA